MMDKTIRVALAGNPNCGKSTTFNAITGSKERVGNYPGITVERKEGCSCVHGTTLRIIDLPGTYSLTAYSMEELVARQVLVDENPELAIDVVDATALERSLYLAVQLMELGVPVVLSMNMMDEVRKKGIHIHTRKLSKRLGVPVVETVAKTGKGIGRLMKATVDYAKSDAIKAFSPLNIPYGPELDPIIDQMVARIEEEDFLTERYPARFTAVKYLENDESLVKRGRERGPLGEELEAMAREAEVICENAADTYPEAIIADYRYAFINDILKNGVMEIDASDEVYTRSDKIDTILTHKIFGPVLMLAILYAMFSVTIELGSYPQELFIAGFEWIGSVCTRILPEGLLQSMVVSGIVDGVGGVLSFVPLILIMFLMLTFLEDLGYMARMAYMMDRIFRFFGLHGSSVMPFIISGGIPGGQDIAQPQGALGNPGGFAVHDVRGQTAFVHHDDSGLFPRQCRTGHAPVFPGGVGRGPDYGQNTSLDCHQGRAHPLCHGTAAIPISHHARDLAPCLGENLAIYQKGRHGHSGHLHPYLGGHDLSPVACGSGSSL